MQHTKQRPWWLLLSFVLLNACSGPSAPERRTSATTANGSANASNPSSETTDSSGTPDNSYGTIDPNFSPDDPNTFSRKPGVNFPAVTFAVEGTPTGPSDRYNYALNVKADASISHYAYKIDSSASCDKTGGYTVGEAKNPIAVSLDKAPMGAVYLCVIAFHFPTRQWQELTKALSYNWEKIAFKRTIDTYYQFVDPNCNNATARINAKITIEADKGSYTWSRAPIAGCTIDTATYTDAMSLITVGETAMQGAWHEGAVVAGWFKFSFTNAERTAFKGTWGYGEPGVKTEGVWNSVGN